MTMHTDELRAELAELANEIAPFEGDPSGVRRRVAKRRAISGSITAIVTIALVVAIVVGVRSGPSHVHVAGSTKEIEITQLPRLDAAVVLPAGATSVDVANVQAVLDSTDAVESYAALPAKSLALALFNQRDVSSKRLLARVCTDSSTRIFAIELARAVPHAVSHLASAVVTMAEVQSFDRSDVDLEIFMQVKATATQVSAVHARVEADRDVIKDTYLDHQAAYAQFKKLFADQPVLIQNETPARLPESFQIELRDGAQASQVAVRYQHLPGVQSVNVQPSGPLTGVPASILGHDACPPKR
jgi:FtsX extracellular domain